ncbi:DUF6478 family protein [Defluviimonas sp. D31]|uniref:DUF6478 family protein n=1 Tax=Defluviimonas sp. D31 TaxID=3083253 RepID=UPI00296EE60D|nr:DUF6478 family protein [Defluviimonas sp. D31]MDW4549649.1 DUF6478 family protein [Defluviimonas sp. D31]
MATQAMTRIYDRLLEQVLFRRTLQRWQRIASRAETADFSVLRRLRGPARQIRSELDRLLRVVDGRLAQAESGARAIRRPPMSDWAWRPEIWRAPVTPGGIAPAEPRSAFGSEATVFHDCPAREVALRQIRNAGGADLPPYGLKLDVLGFEGSFLSLVIELPPAAVEGLTLHHIVRLEAAVEVETPRKIFVRLNLKHGPNTEQMVQGVSPGERAMVAEFDLAYTKMNEKRLERAWIDLIFEKPEMNQFVLRDVTLSRRPRAEM